MSIQILENKILKIKTSDIKKLSEELKRTPAMKYLNIDDMEVIDYRL